MDTLTDLYRTKSDEELLLSAVQANELTPEARESLKHEMTVGRLGNQEVEQQRFDQEVEERETAKRSKSSELKWKRAHFGKRDRVLLDKTNRERFTTTFFISVFYLPVIPVGTYRIERIRKKWRGNMIVLEKKPLDWEQVLRAWVLSSGIALVAIWAFRLWVRFGLK